MSLKRKQKPTAEPVLDASNKRFSGYSFSELKIPAMPVMETDYEAEVEQKLTEMSLAGRGIDTNNYIGRTELLAERLQTVPEFRVPAVPPPKEPSPSLESRSLEGRSFDGRSLDGRSVESRVQEGQAPVPSTAGVLPLSLPPPPSVTQQKMYRRSMSSALPHYCSLERRPRAGAPRPSVWMVRSQSFTDVYQKTGTLPGPAVAAELGRPPLRGGGGRADDRERRNSLRRSMRALSGSWRNLLKQGRWFAVRTKHDTLLLQNLKSYTGG